MMLAYLEKPKQESRLILDWDHAVATTANEYINYAGAYINNQLSGFLQNSNENSNTVSIHYNEREKEICGDFKDIAGQTLKLYKFWKINDDVITNTYWVEAHGMKFNFAFVHEGTDFSKFPEDWTGHFAPIVEFLEDTQNFLAWCNKLSDNAFAVKMFDLQNRMDEAHNRYPSEIAKGEQRIIELQSILNVLEKRKYNDPIKLLDHAVKKKNDYEILLEKADQRAKALLNVWLTPSELESWNKQNVVILNSKLDEDIIYIYRKDNRVQVRKKSTNEIVANMCVNPDQPLLCDNDKMLATVLQFKADENKIIENSNVFAIDGKKELIPKILIRTKDDLDNVIY